MFLLFLPDDMLFLYLHYLFVNFSFICYLFKYMQAKSCPLSTDCIVLCPLHIFRSGHYDPDAVRSCAQTVALHWQTLMLRIEDRLKLVNASAAFYRTSQQVSVLSVCSSGVGVLCSSE